MKKNIFHVSCLILGLAALASCELNDNPTFSDGDAFVTFDSAALSCSESDGEIAIPVTLVSLGGVSATASYEVVAGTAKQGVNFDIANTSGTLSFSPGTATQSITVRILDPDVTYADGQRVSGAYTGDLSFQVTIKGADGAALSMESTCTVTIKDIDHPLTAILGDYTFTARSTVPDEKEAMASWPCEIAKDDTDDHLVWFYDLPYQSRGGFDGWDTSYYGIVSEDLGTITIPLGQTSEYTYSNGEPISLLGVDAAFESLFDEGSVTATIERDASGKVTGLTFNLDESPAGPNSGLIAYIAGAGTVVSYVFGPFTATKNN